MSTAHSPQHSGFPIPASGAPAPGVQHAPPTGPTASHGAPLHFNPAAGAAHPAASPAQGVGIVDPVTGLPAHLVMSVDQFETLQDKDDNLAAPGIVLAIAAVMMLIGNALVGATEAGGIGAIGMPIVAFLGMVLSAGIAVPVALFVGKIFGEDFGDFWPLSLRVCAAIALHELGVVGIMILLQQPFLTVIFGVPVLVMSVMWMVGMDFFQGFVFALICGVIKFMITMLFIGAMFNIAMSGLGM